MTDTDFYDDLRAEVRRISEKPTIDWRIQFVDVCEQLLERVWDLNDRIRLCKTSFPQTKADREAQAELARRETELRVLESDVYARLGSLICDPVRNSSNQ
jgi:hypothetical protein